MVGYRVRNTVTKFGSVARGVRGADGMLVDIVERTKIYQRGEHAVYTEDNETFIDLPGDTIVSMNIWGFTQPMVTELWQRLGTFFAEDVPQDPLKREFYLPVAVNAQLQAGTARARVLPCEEVWHGVTYREDLASVKTPSARAQGRRRLRRTPLAGHKRLRGNNMRILGSKQRSKISRCWTLRLSPSASGAGNMKKRRRAVCPRGRARPHGRLRV